jgi:hypothetical protein
MPAGGMGRLGPLLTKLLRQKAGPGYTESNTRESVGGGGVTSPHGRGTRAPHAGVTVWSSNTMFGESLLSGDVAAGEAAVGQATSGEPVVDAGDLQAAGEHNIGGWG